MADDLIKIDDIVISSFYAVYDEEENTKAYDIIPLKRLENGDIMALEFVPDFERGFEGVGKYYKSDEDSGMFSQFYELDIDARYKRLKRFFNYAFHGKKVDIS